jgi:hypothetical protein
VARAYHEKNVEPERSAKNSALWINSLEQHVPAEIWHAPIDRVSPPQPLDFFIDIKRRLPETGGASCSDCPPFLRTSSSAVYVLATRQRQQQGRRK